MGALYNIIISRILKKQPQQYHRYIKQSFHLSLEAEDGFTLPPESQWGTKNCREIAELTPQEGRWCSPLFSFCLPKNVSLNGSPSHYNLLYITHRNRLTGQLLELLAQLQQRYLLRGDPADLKQIPRQQLVEQHGVAYPDGCVLDITALSRLLQGCQVVIRGESRLLRVLLPGKTEWIGGLLWKMLCQSPRLNDMQLTEQLRLRYGVQYSVTHVGSCRRAAALPALRERVGKCMPRFCSGQR